MAVSDTLIPLLFHMIGYVLRAITVCECSKREVKWISFSPGSEGLTQCEF